MFEIMHGTVMNKNPFRGTFKNCFFVSTFFLLLSGCATVQSPMTSVGHPMSWDARAQGLESIQAWTMNGAVSIQHAEKTELASLQWDQKNDAYQFALFGPLGLGRVEITGQPGRITLAQSNRPPVSAATPELLMQSQLGWQIPIVPLYYWARGLPSPGMSAKTTFDAYHHLVRLKQGKWEIQYPEYMSVGRWDLPRKILLMSDQLKIKLVVKSWVVQPK